MQKKNGIILPKVAHSLGGAFLGGEGIVQLMLFHLDVLVQHPSLAQVWPAELAPLVGVVGLNAEEAALVEASGVGEDPPEDVLCGDKNGRRP